jgi:uncharacterized protein YjbJ (UPF0337 family)
VAGLGDKITGKAKEVEGDLTGDEVRKTQGQAQQTKGDVEDAGESAKENLKGAAQEAQGKLSGDPAEEEMGRARRDL